MLHEDPLEQTDLVKNFNADIDLLYGLHDYRKERTPYLNGTGPIVIDAVNNKIVSQLITEEGYQSNIEESLYQAHTKDMESYYVPQYLTFFKSEAIPYKVRIDRNEYKNKKRSNEDTVIKRCCQAALLKPDVNKHFMLDGINLQDVFEPTSDQYNSFTSAEIRFVFKNWDNIKDTIKFYSNDKEVKNFFAYLNRYGAIEVFKNYLVSKQINPKSINFNQITIENWHIHADVTNPNQTPSPRKISINKKPMPMKKTSRLAFQQQQTTPLSSSVTGRASILSKQPTNTTSKPLFYDSDDVDESVSFFSDSDHSDDDDFLFSKHF